MPRSTSKMAAELAGEGDFTMLSLWNELSVAEASLSQYLVFVRKELESSKEKKAIATRSLVAAQKRTTAVAALPDAFFAEYYDLLPLLVLNTSCVPKEKIKTPPGISSILPLIHGVRRVQRRVERFLDHRTIPSHSAYSEWLNESPMCSYLSNSFIAEALDLRPTKGNLLRLVLQSAHESRRVVAFASRVTKLWQNHESLIVTEAEKLESIKRRLERRMKRSTKTRLAENPTRIVPLCKICCEQELEVALQCGHQTCSTCSRRLRECPMCRSRITRRIRLYY